MANLFSGLASGYSDARNRKRQEQEGQIDQAVKYAQLAESGYNVRQQPKGGMFGGSQMVLERDPSFGSSVPEGFTRVSGKVVRDPSYLNPLQKRRMEMTGWDSGLTAGQRLAKDKATQDLFTTAEMNNVKRSVYDNALEGAQNVPQGFFGKARINTAKSFPAVKGMLGVNDKMIQDAQELKMSLTDATLANAAYTKGAISDKEMSEFSKASANDDFNSPAIVPVLRKLKAFLDAEESGKFGAYQKNYGEDPRTFLPKFGQGSSGTAKSQSFNSPEEADASGLPAGSVVMVQGKRYQI